jgi:hypothetical protein
LRGVASSVLVQGECFVSPLRESIFQYLPGFFVHSVTSRIHYARRFYITTADALPQQLFQDYLSVPTEPSFSILNQA